MVEIDKSKLHPFTLPIELTEILKCIPHRYPFVFLDRVTALEPMVSAEAIKNVSYGDPILQGHFPGQPLFPGVLLVEAIAQLGAVFGHYSLPGGYKDVLLTEVNEARFRRRVMPGDTLHIAIKLSRMRGPFKWYGGEIRVGEELVMSCQISALLQ